jgi:uncharacterized DUF497 family protein
MSVKMAVNYNFEWDPGKARENKDKHSVTFDEAATIFRDSKALSIFDPDHSEIEDMDFRDFRGTSAGLPGRP